MFRPFVIRHSSFVILLALAASSCAVGPNYQRPAAAVPAAYKEAAPGWKPASPADSTLRGPWWEIFNDTQLNTLESQAATANQSIAQAAANYEQARQFARGSRASLFPTLSVAGSAQRAKTPASRSATGTSRIDNLFSASAGASWTPDFWGRVRRTTEANLAAAEASAADLASARLSVEATLAQTYFQLRTTDERLRLRQNAVEAYTRTLKIAQNKYNVGIVARSDVISAQALLDAARAQVIDTQLQRAQLEHAIAVLIGQSPADFALSTLSAQLSTPIQLSAPPAIPPQLPGDLLQRRPDIASAERSVAAANARIGLQTSAYFPDLTISANGGYESSVLHNLLSAPNLFWSLGADIGDTLFDFGQRRANVAAARAAYDASVAGYRGTVLAAFREVEDNLAALRILAEEQKVQDNAVAEAAEAARIAENEYRAGTVDYTTVVTTQVTELNNRQTSLGILETRLTAAVTLIEALGGGWSESDLPVSDALLAGHSSASR